MLVLGFAGNILYHFHFVEAEILRKGQQILELVRDQRVSRLIGTVIHDELEALRRHLRPQYIIDKLIRRVRVGRVRV